MPVSTVHPAPGLNQVERSRPAKRLPCGCRAPSPPRFRPCPPCRCSCCCWGSLSVSGWSRRLTKPAKRCHPRYTSSKVSTQHSSLSVALYHPRTGTENTEAALHMVNYCGCTKKTFAPKLEQLKQIDTYVQRAHFRSPLDMTVRPLGSLFFLLSLV